MKPNKFLLFIVMLSLSGCGQFEVSIEPLQTSNPTSTADIPTSTFTAVASPTVQVNPTATVTSPSPTLAILTATQVQQVPPTSIPLTATTTGQL